MADVEQLSSLLTQTLDTSPTVRAAAEQQLLSLSTSSPAHVSHLLELVATAAAPAPVRLASSIHLKNIIRSRWDSDDAQDAGLPPVGPADKGTLRQNLLPLLLSLSTLASPAPLPLRLQLNTSLSLVASHDFPREWTGLLDDIVARLSDPSPDLGVVQACMATLHEVTKAWRGQFRSDRLYEEINYVLGKFAPVWWTSIQATHGALIDPATPADRVKPLLAVLHLQLLVFYDLSCQDLPPLFEDNIGQITELLLYWLSYTPDPSRLPPSDDDEKPDELTQVRAAVCEAAELYAQRYLDAWEPQVPGFVQAVWEMLGKLEGQTAGKYDSLLSRALSFLSVIVRQPSLRGLFSQNDAGGGSVMESLVQRVILPNVGMKESEEEMFEDEPLAWVKRETEATTETDTPRLSSLAFLRSLLEHFTHDITRIISSYIQTYLAQYTANPSAEWRKKDAAIWLMTGVAAKGSTGRHGVSQASTNQLVNVVEFFSDHIYADLQAAVGTVHPILKVDAIRYLHTFRNQLSKEQLLSVLPLLVQHLESENAGIATYAAIAVESILVIRGPENAGLFTPADVQPFAESILLALFGKIEAGETPEKVAENEFLMKGVMRVLTTGREQIAGAAYATLLHHLSRIASTIAKNPSNPRFSQFTFESVAALIRYATAAKPESVGEFEQALFPPFTEILQQDVAEFVPFVFQLLSQLLELHPAGKGLPESYQSLLPSLLTPALWQSRGNVPALVRLMQAYLTKAAGSMVANNQIPAVLGIYQQLIASRINDEFGFELMQTIFETVDEAALQPFKQAVMTLMLTRLQSSRTEKFSRGFVSFVATLATIRSKDVYPQATIDAFDSVQAGLFAQLVQGVLAAEIAKTPSRKRPLVIVGVGRLLTQSPVLFDDAAPTGKAVVPALLAAVLKLVTDSSIEAKSIEAQQAEADQLFAEDWEEQNTFQAGFSRLAASAPRSGESRDAVAVREITGGKGVQQWLVDSLVDVSKRNPGKLAQLLAADASTGAQTGAALQQLAAAQGLSIQ
ncbi:unnamed protein product [Parajaminaea phylloscopi]